MMSASPSIPSRVDLSTVSHFQRHYRSVLFQTIIVGIVAFSQPGIWNSLQGMGAAGAAKPYLINAANAATYGIMSFGCILAGGLANKIGVKWTLVLGVVFYTPYASALYCNNRYGTEWYVLFGSVLCGIGASMFWASEGAIAVGYPLESERGRMVGLWMSIRNLAPLIGGAISLSLNIKTNGTGKVSYDTYLAFIGLQCIGLPAALLLSPPEKVIRSDGTRPPAVNRKEVTVKSELRALWQAVRRPHMLLLIPVFISGTWGTTYQLNYLTTYFSVRARTLVSLLTAVMGLVANIAFGALIDSKWFGKTQARRARRAWIALGALTTALWVWQTVTQVHFTRRRDAVDWADASKGRFNNAIAVYCLWKFAYEAQLSYLYWLIGTFPYEAGGIERAMGCLRTFESVGSTFSYTVGATHWPNLNQGLLSFALWMACLVPTTLAVARVPADKAAATRELETQLGLRGGGGNADDDVDAGDEKSVERLSDGDGDGDGKGSSGTVPVLTA